MEILWPIIGILIGLLVAWFILDNRCRRQLAEQEERLRESSNKLDAQLQQKVEEHGETRRRLEEMEAKDGKKAQQIASMTAELETRSKELDAAKSEIARLSEALDRSREELEGAKSESTGLTTDLSTARGELEGSKTQATQLKADLDATRKELEGSKSEANRLRGELDTAHNELKAAKQADLRPELQALEAKLKDAEGKRAALESELSQARADRASTIEECQARIAALESERRETDEPAARPSTNSPEDRDDGGRSEPEPASAPLRLVAAAEEPADDLTKIKGIGRVLNQRLNGLGIRTFRQIAEFTQADIDRVNGVLDFPGRIEREKWVDQAKTFVES